jgi:hypothetical protein
MKRITSNNNNLYTQLYTAKPNNSGYIPQMPKPNPNITINNPKPNPNFNFNLDK